MMKYEMNWTQKDGSRIKNQVFTSEYVAKTLARLESEGATEIEVKSIDGNPSESGHSMENVNIYMFTILEDDGEEYEMFVVAENMIRATKKVREKGLDIRGCELFGFALK